MINHSLRNIIEKERFVLGEYTTNSGPFIDDHFIVLVSSNNEFFEFSTTDGDVQELIKKVEKMKNETIKLKLSNVTNFASQIIYPAFLSGEPFYDFKKTKLSLFEYIKSFGISNVNNQLSQVVLNYLNPTKKKSGSR